MNEYTKIATYYDLLMTSGYYDHLKSARAIAPFISPEQSVIEIGVGTGLLLEKLLQIDRNYQLTGIDHTPEMLEAARERLGNRAELYQADILSMSVDSPFDIAISNGGLCAFVDTGSECDFYTHLIGKEDNAIALKNIAECIKPGGLFLINIQGSHDSYDKPLSDGIVYSQQICESTAHPDCIEKTFFFKKDDRILVEQKLIYQIFKGETINTLFDGAGFELKEQDSDAELVIYRKK